MIGRSKIAAATIVMLGAITLTGAKPTPAPSPTPAFDPEIAYTYASGNYMDLRLANRQGTAAVLVHRASFGAVTTFDLAAENPAAPNGPNRISIADRDLGALIVKTWTKNPLAISATAEPIYTGPVESSDFSPDGDNLVFSATGNAPAIIIHDFTPTDGQAAQRVLSTLYYAFWVRWDPSGQNIVFSAGPANGSGPIKLYSISVASTDGVATPLQDLPNGFDLDVSRPPANANSRLANSIYGVLYLSNLDGTNRTRLTTGELAHFNCSNTSIIYTVSGRKRTTLTTTLANPSAPTTWSSDAGIHHTDWLQRSPCT